MTEAGAGYSRGQVDRAGAILKDESATSADRAKARAAVGWWRGRHRTPLAAVRTLLYQRMCRVTAEGFVAQRLKRLPSVEEKLRRFPAMRLSRMQDLGGCRAVVPSVREVDELHHLCRDGRQAHQLSGAKDYLAEPKPDGYRGVHLVYRYCSRSSRKSALNGTRIEIQIRSHLQHAWATAVETVDVLQETRLKIGGVGGDEWKRFFALMGTVHAIMEDRPMIAGTPAASEAVRSELRPLVQRLDVDNELVGLAAALEVIGEGSGWALIVRDAARRRGFIRHYSASRSAQAQKDYLLREAEHENQPAVQVCLVSTNSVEDLRRAYPNYYLDVGFFVGSMRRFLEEPKNR